MIINDDNGFYAFGITDEQAPADAMLIYARTETKCLAIIAHRDGGHVHSFMVDCPLLDSEHYAER